MAPNRSSSTPRLNPDPKTMQKVGALAAFALVGGLFLGAAWVFQPTGATADVSTGDPFAHLPDTMELSAVIRDFKPNGAAGGHPDFQSFSGTTTVGLVKPELDGEGLPVLDDTRGQRIVVEYQDSSGRNINPALYDASRGDAIGSLESGPSSNGLTNSGRFSQWYRDVPGVNSGTVVPLTLTRVENTGRYVFDSDTDEPYASKGGFFPIDGVLYGNYDDWGKNFHFTTQIVTEFTYVEAEEQSFKFTGDDDVWVFIDGKLVLDLGGLHPVREQYLDLSRLDWLVNGQTYELRVFHAERRTSASNFRMETTLRLRNADLPPVAGLHD